MQDKKSIDNRLSKRSKLQLHLDPLSAKGEATNPETSHTAKMSQPVKVVSHFLTSELKASTSVQHMKY